MTIRIGNHVGNWKVISEKFKENKVYKNTCQCICGTIRNVPTWHLNNNKSKGCGCTNIIGRFKAKCVGDLSASYYTSFKYSRQSKGIEFSDDLSMGHLWYLYEQQEGRCALSGIPIPLNPQWSQQNKGKSTKIVQTASIDRIDSSKGYTPDNIVLTINEINIMKNNLTIKEFKTIVTNIYKHFCKE